MTTRRRFNHGLLACALASAATKQATAASGSIRIGQSTSLTGPLAKDCQASLLGAQTYLKQVNDAGGIDGAKVELITLDDSFDEKRAAENTRALIQREQVIGLFQYGGTGPTVAASRVLEDSNVPLLGPVSGAPFWRDIKQAQNVYAIRAGYEREMQALVRQLSAMGINDVALVLQDAAFTKALVPIAREQFQSHLARSPVAEILIDRTEEKAAEAAKRLAALGCRATILVSTSRPAALLIREARKAAPGMVIMALSTVAPDQLREVLKPEEIRGVGIAQTIPNPNAIRLPIVQEYQSVFRKSGLTALDHFSIEGFINAKVLVAALRRSGPMPTAAKLRTGIESLRDFDLGGMRVTFGPRDRTGSTFVDVTVIGHEGKVLK